MTIIVCMCVYIYIYIYTYIHIKQLGEEPEPQHHGQDLRADPVPSGEGLPRVHAV